MTVVEVNTFFLIAKRHIKRFTALLNAAFLVTWIAIRVLWFPFVAAHVWLLPTSSWPDALRRYFVCITTSALALLQLIWTRNALRPMLAKRGTPGSGFL